MIDTTRNGNVVPFSMVYKKFVVIGAGATGSAIVNLLAKSGFEDIEVWDFDKVESHNISNQQYGIHHVGMPKVEALAEVVERDTGIKINPVNRRFSRGMKLQGDCLFNLVDSIPARQNIAKAALKGGFKIMIETRLGVRHGQVFTVPCEEDALSWWESTLPPKDAEVEVSPCGTPMTILASVQMLASLAWWTLINIESDKPVPAMQAFQIQDKLEVL